MKKLLLLLLCVPFISISQDYKTLEVIDAEYNTDMGTNFPDFSPIGWSKNGEFAFQIIIEHGGIGLVKNSIYIISTKTDQVLDSIDLIDWETGEYDLNIGKKDFTSYTMDLTKKYIEINSDYRT